MTQKFDLPYRYTSDPERYEKFSNYCEKNNMKFLKNSYDSFVHQKFDDFFKISHAHLKFNKLANIGRFDHIGMSKIPLDHSNLFRSTTHKNVYILTASPHFPLIHEVLEAFVEYPYNVYVINPNLLDYRSFIEHRIVLGNSFMNPIKHLTYAFTDASREVISDINEMIMHIGISSPFYPLKIRGGD